ncbi:hypothetical protein MHK_001755, partial [Candidatus Magnetomorum sp. HK-1]
PFINKKIPDQTAFEDNPFVFSIPEDTFIDFEYTFYSFLIGYSHDFDIFDTCYIFKIANQ